MESAAAALPLFKWSFKTISSSKKKQLTIVDRKDNER